MNFSMATPSKEQVTFTIEVDKDGKLTKLYASQGDTLYDCKIQLTSRDNPAVILCCTDICTPGPC